MQTQCPHCHTVFRIAQAQLDMAGGMVRCGYCKQVFDAGLSDAQPQDSDDSAVSVDSQASTTEANHKVDDRSHITADSNDAVADVNQLGPDAKSYSALATTAWSLAILALITTLLAEYLWFNQAELFQQASLKPVTARICQLIDCERLQMRDASQIEMLSRNVYTHPNENNALMVSTTIVNQASYAQPYPHVQIDFSDLRGELIASRRFTPEEYLQTNSQHLSLLQSGKPTTFGLEIRDPGEQAITYEFSFH